MKLVRGERVEGVRDVVDEEEEPLHHLPAWERGGVPGLRAREDRDRR